MKPTLIYPAGFTEACHYAALELIRLGLPVTNRSSPDITHILLDVPSIRGKNTEANLAAILSGLPPDITIIGGNLDHPLFSDYNRIDLLQDADYLVRNAAITAEAALRVAGAQLKTTLPDSPALILGYGRIGKCLARMLKNLDCPVTVAARKESDRAMIHALGYAAADYPSLPAALSRYRILFNTVPVPVLTEDDLRYCRDCIKIELASQNGLLGDDVLIARGLPGAYAPASSGKRIVETILRLI